MKDLVNFQGKKILIVGGSSGIGRATAILLSRLGAQLVLVSRHQDKLKDTLSQLDGTGHVSYQADMYEVDQLPEFIGKLCKECGGFDGLVYSAGAAYMLPLNMTTEEKLLWVFRVNCFAFLECVKQLTRKGRFNPGMRIVGVSSVASVRGCVSQTAYSASKAAMDGAVRSMAPELAKKGICINTVLPGMTNTAMYSDFIAQNGEDALETFFIQKRQFRGICEPEDIANAIAFLLSDAARFITGTSMPVDGGYTV